MWFVNVALVRLHESWMVSLVITVISNADVMSSRHCVSVPCDVFHFDKGLDCANRGSISCFDVQDQQPSLQVS